MMWTNLLRRPLGFLPAANAAALLLVAAWFRCRALGHVPGLNGDEAWYGAAALAMLRGDWPGWTTPTGNPLNPFFLGPMVLLHAVFAPSAVVLRSVAVLSGLLALAVNWLLCRRVFDRRMAALSTVALAVVPLDIAYGRFAWDASQSLLATLPVWYLSLAAVRFPAAAGRLIGGAGLALAAAVVVHPTNVFAGAAIAAASAARWRWSDLKQAALAGLKNPRVAAAALAVAVVLAAWIVAMAHTPLPARMAWRLSHASELVAPRETPHVAVLYPRLFTGGTVYRYVAGSQSWLEWPNAAGREGPGLDAALFWILVGAAGWRLYRSWKIAGRIEDRALLGGWALATVAFLLLAGPQAMVPGQERFAVCLVAPTVILASRAAALWADVSRRAARLVFMTAALAGWLLLADFHQHYFRFIERTGGRAHPTFRTAAVEPKRAALDYILRNRGPQPAWIVAGAWWNYWPLRYLAAAERDVRVVTPEALAAATADERPARSDRPWHVEFSGSDELRRVRASLVGRPLVEREILDYGGRPVLSVLRADGRRRSPDGRD